MKKPYHKKSWGGSKGGQKFGGDRGFRGGYKGGSDRFERKELFDAVCSTCGDDCQVPFKPSGDRPVLCRRCFRKDQGDDERPARFDRPSFDDDRRPFKSFDKPKPDNSRVEARLAALEDKLDQLIEILTEAAEE